MTRQATLLSALGASALGLALLTSFSVATAKVLLGVWLICSPLFLMARLNDLRRGLEAGYGRLPARTLATLALWSLVVGLMIATLIMIFTTVASAAFH